MLNDLEFGYYHWHYRPSGSVSRAEFVNLLRTERFEIVDESKRIIIRKVLNRGRVDQPLTN